MAQLFLTAAAAVLLCVILVDASAMPPLSMLAPAGFAVESHQSPPDPQFWSSSLYAPYPTNQWWQNLVLADGSMTVDTMPYVARVNVVDAAAATTATRGLQMGLPKKVTQNDGVYASFAEGVQLGATTQLLGHKVIAYDLLTVTLQFQSAAIATTAAAAAATMFDADIGGGSYMRIPLMRGAVHQTAIYHQLLPAITTLTAAGTITTVNGVAAACCGKSNIHTNVSRLLLQLNNGLTVLVYSSLQATWRHDMNGVAAVTPTATKVTRATNAAAAAAADNNNEWIVRVAILPASSITSRADAITLLDRYSNVYAVGCDYQFAINNSSNSSSSSSSSRNSNSSVEQQMIETFVWDKRSFATPPDQAAATRASTLLMAAMPHHQHIFVLNSTAAATNATNGPAAVAFFTALQFDSLLGRMRCVDADVWTTATATPTITWTAPRAIDAKRVEAIRRQLHVDSTIEIAATDMYNVGKETAKIARLALIADELNEQQLMTTALNKLEAALMPWLLGGSSSNKNNSSSSSSPLVYEDRWGGLVTRAGLNDPGAEYGNGFYNDLHVHFGYCCYSLAVLFKLRPSLIDTAPTAAAVTTETTRTAKATTAAAAATVTAAALDFVRNIANPSASDPYFCRYRHYDAYSSHSWASGLFALAAGRSQESSSEAVNSGYSIHLLGLALRHDAVAAVGLMLLTAELRGTHHYWHMTVTDSVYDEPYSSSSSKCVGSVWSTKAVTLADRLYVHGVQMLPFTPVTELLLPVPYVTEQYPALAAAASVLLLLPQQQQQQPVLPVVDSWLGFMYADHAILDSAAAWQQLLTLKTFDNGATLTNFMYWTATRGNSNNSSSSSSRQALAATADTVHYIEVPTQADFDHNNNKQRWRAVMKSGVSMPYLTQQHSS